MPCHCLPGGGLLRLSPRGVSAKATMCTGAYVDTAPGPLPQLDRLSRGDRNLSLTMTTLPVCLVADRWPFSSEFGEESVFVVSVALELGGFMPLTFGRPNTTDFLSQVATCGAKSTSDKRNRPPCTSQPRPPLPAPFAQAPSPMLSHIMASSSLK